jgi:choloylglycine hydrolase
MCTAIKVTGKNNFFGRNLDINTSYKGVVAIVKRNYPLRFKAIKEIYTHYAYIGMATIIHGLPLFADGMNEHGLAIAALELVGPTKYRQKEDLKINIAPYEIIPFILGTCKNIKEVKQKLFKMNIIDIDLNKFVKNTYLHFLVSDRKHSIVIEAREDGLKVFDNPYGVLTNTPIFEYHMENIKNYMNLSIEDVRSRFSKKINLAPISKGQGAYSLPGDFTSPSRFIRAAFIANNFYQSEAKDEAIRNYFRVLNNLSFIKGVTLTSNKEFEITAYSSLMDQDLLTYFYRSYDNSRINGVSLFEEDLNGDNYEIFPDEDKNDICFFKKESI